MTIPEETLMAYVDDELDAARRLEVEKAIAADSELARRVDRHRALRKRLGSEFDPVLFETVPDSLVAVVHEGARKREASVTDLRRVRAARAAEAKETASARRPATAAARPRWTWAQWGAMAASLAVGAVIAHLVLQSSGSSDLIGSRNGQLIAQGDLDQALSSQLARDQSTSSPVRIGVSFKAKSGEYCRTFLVRESSPLGGLACRQGDEWRVQALAMAEAAAANAQGEFRPASSMPPAVVTAVEQRIADEPLDASAEAAARAEGWK